MPYDQGRRLYEPKSWTDVDLFILRRLHQAAVVADAPPCPLPHDLHHQHLLAPPLAELLVTRTNRGDGDEPSDSKLAGVYRGPPSPLLLSFPAFTIEHHKTSSHFYDTLYAT